MQCCIQSVHHCSAMICILVQYGRIWELRLFYAGLSKFGWVAKIMKVDKRGKDKRTTLKFHDGTEHFQFDVVKSSFKVLN